MKYRHSDGLIGSIGEFKGEAWVSDKFPVLVAIEGEISSACTSDTISFLGLLPVTVRERVTNNAALSQQEFADSGQQRQHLGWVR